MPCLSSGCALGMLHCIIILSLTVTLSSSLKPHTHKSRPNVCQRHLPTTIPVRTALSTWEAACILPRDSLQIVKKTTRYQLINKSLNMAEMKMKWMKGKVDVANFRAALHPWISRGVRFYEKHLGINLRNRHRNIISDQCCDGQNSAWKSFHERLVFDRQWLTKILDGTTTSKNNTKYTVL